MHRYRISARAIAVLSVISMVASMVPPIAPAIAPVKEAKASTRLGLHVTQEELNCWKQRAGIVPAGSLTPSCSPMYRTAGDVQTNSPGDWTRIVNNRNAFVGSPTSERWAGPTAEGFAASPVASNYDTNPNRFMRMFSAAFHHMIANDTTARDLVKQELLWHARTSGLAPGNVDDWANRTRWPTNPRPWGDGGIALSAPILMYRLVIAFDYLLAADMAHGTTTFTAQEKSDINAFFLRAAELWSEYEDKWLEPLWTNRYNNSYVANYPNDYFRIAYYGGPNVGSFGARYNNRKAVAYQLGAAVGIQQNNTLLKDRAKLYVKEWLLASVFPQGFTGEFERWEATGTARSELGWAYNWIMVHTAVAIADHMARTGDFELYNFTERRGVYGSQSTTGQPDKSLRWIVQQLFKYHTHTYDFDVSPGVRYGTDQAGNQTSTYQIDGHEAGTGWEGNHDVWMAMSNIFWNDTFINQAYRRQTPNTRTYTNRDEGNHTGGGGSIWMGAWSNWPGILFMFGQMENVVNPYGATSPTPSPTPTPTPTPSSQTNPVAHWKLDEAGGTTASDSSGTNPGTLINGPVFQPAGGKINGALSLDGANDHVSVPNSSSLSVSGDLTIAGWLYPTNLAKGRQGIVFKHYNNRVYPD